MYSKDTGKDQMLMTMERALTSGQKAGFFFLGFLGGIVGILAASLMNINAPYRPEGTKMAALGFATACVLGTLIALALMVEEVHGTLHESLVTERDDLCLLLRLLVRGIVEVL